MQTTKKQISKPSLIKAFAAVVKPGQMINALFSSEVVFGEAKNGMTMVHKGWVFLLILLDKQP